MGIPDQHGGWGLGTADPTGHWVAAIAEGLAPAFLDGDAWTGEPVTLTVPIGRSITVYVDEPELLVGGAVRLVSASPADSASAWPSPGECRSFRHEVLFDLQVGKPWCRHPRRVLSSWSSLAPGYEVSLPSRS